MATAPIAISSPQQRSSHEESYVIKAVIAGCACAIAGALLNPLDVVKIRYILSYFSFRYFFNFLLFLLVN